MRLVRRAIWRHGLPREEACEIVHDAFLLAVTKIDLGRKPKAWLYGVVDRLCANWRRKTGRRSRLLAEWGFPGAQGEKTPSPEEECE